MKKSLFLLGLLAVGFASAQAVTAEDKKYLGKIGVNTLTPKATLDIQAITEDTAKGILIPRLSSQQLIDMPVGVDQHSLLVYMTEPVELSKRAGAFTKVDNEGYYYYYADKTNPSNNYWKKILEVGEHLPRYDFINKGGIDNDIAINNYYDSNYDGANFVIQNYLGNPTNKTILPHDLSTIGRNFLNTGGLVFRVKLGTPFDNPDYGDRVNTAQIATVSSRYYGINSENQVESGIFMGTRSSGSISINHLNSKNIVLSTSKEDNSVQIKGKLSVSKIPVYDSDAAADADTSLLSGSLYRLSNAGRQVFVKP